MVALAPAHEAEQWAAHTLDVLVGLADQPGSGVRLAREIDVSNTGHDPPSWFRLLTDRRPCSSVELPSGYQYGHRYTAPLIDMPKHVACLVRRLESAGGSIESRRAGTLDDAARLTPLVVNCSGLGACDLVDDAEFAVNVDDGRARSRPLRHTG